MLLLNPAYLLDEKVRYFACLRNIGLGPKRVILSKKLYIDKLFQ